MLTAYFISSVMYNNIPNSYSYSTMAKGGIFIHAMFIISGVTLFN